MVDAASPVRLRLDSNALVDNWQTLARLSGEAATGAAVKADGYGLGARDVVSRLSKAGCQEFFVAHWAEAAAIADIVPASQISVLNGVTDSDVAFAKNLGAIPVLNTPEQIVRWKAGKGGRCHVMLDSGINRLGIGPDQLDATLFDGLDLDILMSHLASADEEAPQNELQLGQFTEMARGIAAKRRSLANSAGIIFGPDYHFDLTRPGLSLYGGIARPEMADVIKPVVSISTKVLQVRMLRAGDAVGYNATFICPTDMRVATLAIGYADGYLRGFSNKGVAIYGDKSLPLIGRVSMDMVIVDASQAPNLQEGDWTDVAFGLLSAAEQSGLSQYELLTALGGRYERIWC